MGLSRVGIVPLAAVMIFAAGAAPAAELPELLDAALKAGETAKDARWAFTQTFDLGGEVLRARFDPRHGGEERWTLLSPEGSALDGDTDDLWEGLRETTDADERIIYDRLRPLLSGGVTLLRETPEALVYSFAPQPDGPDDEDAEMMQYVRGEVEVKKMPVPYVTRIRLYAEAPFKPNLMTKIEAFEQTSRFDFLTAEGPPVLAGSTSHVSGSVLFRDFEENVTTVVSDVEKVTVTD